MTNKEAQLALANLKRYISGGGAVDRNTNNAIDMAISALEKQEQAENEWCPDCAEYDKENHCCHRFTKVIRQTVEERKREWANEGWIPVTERLPEDDTEVFVYLFDSKSPYIAWICDGQWYTEEFRVEEQNEPIAWMPLPEPHTEENYDR